MSTAVESAPAVKPTTAMEVSIVEATTPTATEAKPNHGPTHKGWAVATVVGAIRVANRAGRICNGGTDTDEHAGRGGGGDGGVIGTMGGEIVAARASMPA